MIGQTDPRTYYVIGATQVLGLGLVAVLVASVSFWTALSLALVAIAPLAYFARTRREADEPAKRVVPRQDRLREVCRCVLTSFLMENGLQTAVGQMLDRLRETLGVEAAGLMRLSSGDTDAQTMSLEEPGDFRVTELRPVIECPELLSEFTGQEAPLVLNRSVPPIPDALRGMLDRRHLESCTLVAISIRGTPSLVLVLGSSEEQTWSEEEGELLMVMTQSLRAALETRITQRQGITKAVQLRKALEGARTASQAKSEFLANMSHEIRSPMTAIVGFGQLLTRAQVSEDERLEWAGHVARNADHLHALVNGILDLSKIEAGELKLDIQSCNVRDLVDQVLQLLRPRAADKLIELNYEEVGPVPDFIPLDELRFRQILINLITNAVKFTDDGQVTLDIGMEENADGENPVLRIRVSDTGIGIAKEKIGSLFKRFTQAHRRSDYQLSGTGLGLALVKHFVSMLGGEVFAESELGKGSVFTVRLTISPDVELTFHSPETVSKLDKADRIEEEVLRGRRLLVVDDNPTNRDLFGYLLRAAGATLVFAEDGSESIEIVEKAGGRDPGFDAILMDMQMPVMNGYDATLKLREMGVTTEIIALTANAMAEDEAKCLSAGCSGFLPKPIDPDHFAYQIHTILTVERKANAREEDGGGVFEQPSDSSTNAALIARESSSAPVGRLLGEENQAQQDPMSESPAEHPGREHREEELSGQEPKAAKPSSKAAGIRSAHMAVIERMRSGFIEELPGWIQRIESIEARGDEKELRSQLHQLKGTAGSLGLKEVSEAAARGEQHLKQELPLAEIVDALHELRTAVLDVLETTKSVPRPEGQGS